MGSAKALLDGAIRLAGAAAAHEVPVKLEAWPEIHHVRHSFHPVLSDARKAIAMAGQFIRERMRNT